MPRMPLLLAMGVFSLLQGETFEPIPASVWAMKEDPAKGIKGAVVLEDRTSFKNTYVAYRYRVRIFGESGRSAAELRSFPEGVYDIEGRTVYPDGKIVLFRKRQDLTSKTLKAGSSESTQTVLIPPGVTGNCVVEVTWKESSAGWSPLPARSPHSFSLTLANAFPTQEIAVEVPASFPALCQAFPTKTHRPEVSQSGSNKVFAYRNVPAREPVDYTCSPSRPFPRFMAYLLPDAIRSAARLEPARFWQEAARSYFGAIFVSEVSRGRAFKKFSETLRSGVLKGGPGEQAMELMSRLEGAIQNRNQLTAAEKAALSQQQLDEKIEAGDLGEAVEKNRTSSLGMAILYFHLLKDHGLRPRIGLATDGTEHLLILGLRNVFQFSGVLIGVEELGKSTLWIEPGRRGLRPGIIHPDFQGTRALVIDPDTDWATAEVQIHAQPPETNRNRYALEVFPEEGSDRFTLKASFQGYAEYLEKTRFMALEPKEQERTLRERLEGIEKGSSFTRISVKGAQDPRSSLTWEAEGSIEREGGRQRTVDPFPSLGLPLYIPDAWPTERRDPIVLPYLRTVEYSSQIHIPEGWHWGGGDTFDKANDFGTVQWSATQGEGKTVKVHLFVQTKSFFSPASSYEAFKTFLGWVKEASERTLILKRQG